MSYPVPDFLSLFTASTSLETPQINVAFEYSGETVVMKKLRLRRSALHHAVSETEGTLVGEWVANFPDALSESAGLAADTGYYYAAWCEYNRPIHHPLVTGHRVDRFFYVVYGIQEGLVAGYVRIVGRGPQGYSQITYDLERGYVSAETMYTNVPQGIKCAIGEIDYPPGSGQMTQFFMTQDQVFGIFEGQVLYSLQTALQNVEPTGVVMSLDGAGFPLIFYVLDNNSSTLIAVDNAGAILGTLDWGYLGDDLVGLAVDPGWTEVYVGSGYRIYAIDTTANAINTTIYSTLPARLGLHVTAWLGTRDGVRYDGRTARRLEVLDGDFLVELFVLEKPDVDQETLELYHAETDIGGAILGVATAGAGAPGILNGTAAVVAGGKFSNCIDLPGPADWVDFSPLAAIGPYPSDTGQVEFFVKCPVGVWTDANPYTLFHGMNSIGPEYILVTKLDPFIVLTYDAGGGPVTVVVPTPNTALWHRIVVSWDAVGGFLTIQLDEDPPIQGPLGPPIAPGQIDSIAWGAQMAGVQSWPGQVDEIRFQTAPRHTIYAFDTSWIRAGTAEAWSGSDKTTGTHYRDILGTSRMIPETILENKDLLWVSGPDLVTSAGETVRRDFPGDPQGDTARLFRMLGLFFDRLRDQQRYVLPASTTDALPAVLSKLLVMLGIPDINEVVNPRTLETYPVDRVRVYAQLRAWLAPKVGILAAIQALIRFYGLRAKTETTLARVHFDSGIPFDSGINFDTWNAKSRRALFSMDLYDNDNPMEGQVDGVTSAFAVRQLTTVAGNFVTAGVRPGDMVRLLDSVDLGDYLVNSVVGPGTLDITEDWPIGGAAGVSYLIIPAVPSADQIWSYIQRQVELHSPQFLKVVG